MVIGHAKSADFERMLLCCARAEAAITLEDFEHWDSMPHEFIADSAHNTFISSVCKLINQARSEAEWRMLKRRSATPERGLEYQHEHRRLVEALMQRDSQSARELCTAHLLHVRVNMLGY